MNLELIHKLNQKTDYKELFSYDLESLEERLQELVNRIRPLSEQAKKESIYRWDHIAKPLHGLGDLEEIVAQMAGIQETSHVTIEKKALVIMCADNGVVEEGVTQTGQEVTAIVSENFLNAKTSARIMADHTNTDVFPVDIGIARDTCIISRKVAYGTKNLYKEPAMTRKEAIISILIGTQLVEQLKENGYGMIATGEMGIGNTTTSSAVASVLLGVPVEEVTGRGAGLTTKGLEKKIDVIKSAIQLHNLKNTDIDVLDIISSVGGFDLCGLVGVFLGGAIYRVPIVIDGFISAVSALAADRICKFTRMYAISSHVSREPACTMVLQAMDKVPHITCGMSLGEGTGALAFIPILELALSIYKEMSTFHDIQIEDYQPLN